MKKIFLIKLSLILLSNVAFSQIEIKKIKDFNEKIIFNDSLTQSLYIENVAFYNNIDVKSQEFDNYFNILILNMINEIRKKIVDKNDLEICIYVKLPNEIKSQIISDNFNNVYFLIDKKNKTLITHYILNKNFEIISFFNELSKKEKKIFKPWYLNEEIKK